MGTSQNERAIATVAHYYLADLQRRRPAGDRRHGGAGDLRSGGSVLATRVHQSGRSRRTLGEAGDVARSVAVQGRVDAGLVVREAR